MISTRALVTRIESALTAARSTATVSRILDFEAVLAADLRDAPMLWVVLDSETAAPNALDIGVSQQIEVQFSTIYAAIDIDALDTLRALVRSALLGWVPLSDDGTATPFEHRSGEIADLAGDIIWWRENYATTYIERAV